MAAGNTRTPVLKNEDWWACFIGWAFLGLAIFGLLPAPPKIAKGWSELSSIFPQAAGATFTTSLWFFGLTLVAALIAGIFLKFDLKKFVGGYLVIFLLAYVAMIVSKQSFMNEWGISYVLFGLIFGLVISNVFRTPRSMKAAGQTEFFVKIGLVCMGATIIFSDIVEAGQWGIVQAVFVATTVWFMTYWICRKFGVEERFSAIIASANSICGVSATIAAGGAIQGKPKEISYMVAWVLVCAVVLILVMPPIAVALGLSEMWAGAWMGGVIDNTGAVVAAGEILESEKALKVAGVVKMAQNVLIGLAAFLMALWSTLSLDRKENPDAERPSLMEVWYRFPKFVVGFVVASLIISFLVEPDQVAAVSKACKSYRSWFFALCFVAIGLETNFKELVSVGGGRPAIAYWISQIANAFWTLFVAWVIWSGTFFEITLE